MSSEVQELGPELVLESELGPELELGPGFWTGLGQCGCREKGEKHNREVEGREKLRGVLVGVEVEVEARQGRDENEVV